MLLVKCIPEMLKVHFMLGFPLTPNLLSEIWLALCNPETFDNKKTLESVYFPPCKQQVNNNSFRLCDEFSATVIDETA